MHRLFVVLALSSIGVGLVAPNRSDGGQERRVPDDSSRITIVGCANDRLFLTDLPASKELPAGSLAPGRRFRLSGRREVLAEIRKREATMVEITGLVKKADLAGPGGVTMLGGRIRIGGAPPRDAARDPMFNQVVIDVESFQPLPDSCPARD
jgi:hypothetical protein